MKYIFKIEEVEKNNWNIRKSTVMHPFYPMMPHIKFGQKDWHGRYMSLTIKPSGMRNMYINLLNCGWQCTALYTFEKSELAVCEHEKNSLTLKRLKE